MAILMKSGDTAPDVKATLKDADGNAVDLAGASVKFVLATKASPRTVKVDATASVDQVSDGTDGSKGKVSYAWLAGDTDSPGSYVAEFEVVYSDGEVQTFPTQGYVDCTITADLGGTT